MKELTLDERKIALLEVLKKFHEICEENNLTYYLSGGTLLGAIRHKGFIPWDDDVDVWMPIEDLEKLNTLTFDGYYYWDCAKDKKYPLTYGRFQKNGTLVKEGVCSFSSIELGINIDVFALYEGEKRKIESISKEYHKLSRNYRLKSYVAIKGENPIKNAIKKILHFSKFYVNFNENALRLRNLLKRCSSSNNDCIFHAEEYAQFIFEKNYFKERTKCKFENLELYIPNGYHEILTTMYGDYMTPPKNKDSKHRTRSYIL